MRKFLKGVNHNAFTKNTVNGVTFYTVNKISELGIIHGFTSRLGGFSPGYYKSLNLSKTRENNIDNKIKNYKAVCAALGIDYDSLTLVNYEHGNNAYILLSKDRGAGLTKKCEFENCDALITDNPALTPVTLHADCTPIFTIDIENRVVSVAHAGWKGTVTGMVNSVIEKLKSVYNSKSHNIIVAIGPHIMSGCFEIKEDVAEKLSEIDKNSIVYKNDKIFGDLQYIILKQLYENEISPKNVYCADLCTYCNEDLFYSHRRDHGLTGAMGAFINVGR